MFMFMLAQILLCHVDFDLILILILILATKAHNRHSHSVGRYCSNAALLKQNTRRRQPGGGREKRETPEGKRDRTGKGEQSDRGHTTRRSRK
jgi:hypothetical protein